MPHKPYVRTLRAQWLGQLLRKLREERGMTLELAAGHLRRDRSALCRYELAEWPIGRSDVAALLDLYGFHHAAERTRILALAEEVWRTDRWDQEYGDIAGSFIEYTWLESRAAEIKFHNPVLIPGMLQTREYAEIVSQDTDAYEIPADTLKRLIELRMERQEIMYREHPPRISAVIEEFTLRRMIGGPHVMRAQLEHLRALNGRPNVEIRVLPATIPAHPGAHGAFVVFTMPKPYPAVAYIENLGGRLYLEEPKAQRFVDTYDCLWTAALDRKASSKLITAIAEEMT